MNSIRLHDEWVSWGKSGGVFSDGDTVVEFSLHRTGYDELDGAQEEVSALVRSGMDFVEAVNHVSEREHQDHVRAVHKTDSGLVVVDDTATTGAEGGVATLKTVTQLAGRDTRVVVAAGAFDFSGASDYDSLDAFGALMVRLNVSQVFAVGPEARSLFLSVGREGSWDGESQHCGDVEEGYAELRAFIRPGDVVLVMGSSTIDLYPLVERLIEVTP